MGSTEVGTVVVIGASHAGSQVAASLRTEGFTGRIILLGDEAWPPYDRPQQSKAFLTGKITAEATYLRKASFYADKGIELRLGERAVAIDRAAHQVELASGEKLGYDKLVLATGSRLRRLTIPGADLPGVYYLRTMDDAIAIRAKLVPGAAIVTVGAGYIGLEVAAAAAKAGAKATILEMADRVMARTSGEPISHCFQDEHRAHGVDLRLNTGINSIEGGSHVTGVVTSNGDALPADAVVVGVGVLANDELAVAAGIVCDNGVVVDEFARTSDPDIFACGDVTNHPNPLLGGRYRIESVQNAASQAVTAARTVLGTLKPYGEVPWFWTEQYDLKLQIAGLRRPTDQLVLRGDPATRKFSVLYLRDGKLAAIETVNNLKDFMPAKKLIAEGRVVDPVAAADPAVPLASLG